MDTRDSLTTSTEKAWDLAAQRYAGEVEEHIAFLRHGGISLSDVERRLLGDPIAGRVVIHLQCSTVLMRCRCSHSVPRRSSVSI